MPEYLRVPRSRALDEIVADAQDGIAPDPNHVIRVVVSVRSLWKCAAGHEHRWRLTAWLCNCVSRLMDTCSKLKG